MRRPHCGAFAVLLLGSLVSSPAWAQNPPPGPYSWQQLRERFLANNPALTAQKLLIQEQEANVVTAGLRPNPQLSVVLDQFQVYSPNPLRPFQNGQWTGTVTQLIERQHKRQLRVESARYSTSMASTDLRDLERQLTWNLKDAYIRTLQAKRLLQNAEENLAYYDKVIAISKQRLDAGDLAKVDFYRIELQRVQFESDRANALVNLRTAKIQLMSILNERSAVDDFDVSGDFDYKEHVFVLDEMRHVALEQRGDLQSAATAIRKAETDHRLAWANGSWDPTIGFEYQRTPGSPASSTAGVDYNIPIRIFDRNQGEKARTRIDIERAKRLREGIEVGIYRDVDSALETIDSVRVLIRPYREKYLKEAVEIREIVSFSYSKGGSTLLDFLDAQKEYRDTQLNYTNLIASYLSAVNQLELAMGREILP